jgi:hypothetical protein
MYTLEGTVDRFEEGIAIIKLETGASLLWPKEKLPPQTNEGMLVKISINTDLDKTQGHEDLAKNLLNEILRNE